MNTENYLLQKNRSDYQNISLSSLIPFEEYEYEYSHDSMIKHAEEFEFQSIGDQQRGVFIITFIGDELESKVTISKGCLKLVNDGLSGRNCVILDERNEVLKSDRTGFYYRTKFFRANEEGVVQLPMNFPQFNGDVVVIHGKFAQLCHLSVMDPKFQLQTELLFNSESFISGNMVNLILLNRLFINNVKSSLSQLQNVTAEIKCINEVGVQNTTQFKDLQLKDGEDLSLQFVFPSKVQQLRLSLHSEIKFGDETKKVESFNEILIDLDKLKNQQHDIFFNQVEQGKLKV